MNTADDVDYVSSAFFIDAPNSQNIDQECTMADRLAALLDRFFVTAKLFHAGALCGVNTLEAEGVGYMHLIRRGRVNVFHGNTLVDIERPSLLLYPRPIAHRFITDPEHGADMACARLFFDGGARNAICAALPDVLLLPTDEIAGAAALLNLLFEEAFAERCGRVAMVNRLFEAVIIQVLRLQLERGDIKGGMLAGLAHPRLRHALVALHEAPTRDWTLDDLARTAGMSRSAFSRAFREVLGLTSGQYLQAWRVSLAQRALLGGRPLKAVATEVGYGSEAALSRAFKAHSGVTPREWKRAAQHA